MVSDYGDFTPISVRSETMMTNDTKAQGLLPCPFCGASDPSDVFVNRLQSDGRRWTVYCTATDCLTEGPHRATKREAIAAWNTRSDLAARDAGEGE